MMKKRKLPCVIIHEKIDDIPKDSWLFRRGNSNTFEFRNDDNDSVICTTTVEKIKALGDNWSVPNFSNWDECECKDCGFTWNASSTDHFNFTFCDMCFSTDIGGEYHEDEVDYYL